MLYSEQRNKIKSGDVVAFNREGIVTMFTTSEYSHVGLVWKVSGRLFLIEAVAPYVRIMPLSNFKDKGFYVLSMKEPMSKAETEMALSQVGVGGYSYLDCVKAYFNKLNIGESKSWECAELVIACRRMSGVDLGNKATPSAVVQSALEQGYEMTFVKGE